MKEKSRRDAWWRRHVAARDRLNLAHSRQIEQRMKPLHARSHKAAALLRARRIETHQAAYTAAHLRAVARDGDDGYRCDDCGHIPLRPWESEPEFSTL